MWLVMIIIAIAIMLIVLSFSPKYKDEGMGVVLAVSGTLLLVIGSWLIPMLVATAVVSEQRYQQVDKTNLICIKDNTLINGAFFLFSGAINEETFYFYYTQEADGAIQFEKKRTQYLKIYEDAPENVGYLLTTYNILKRDAGKWEHWCLYTHSGVTYVGITAHVPPGTVKRQFVLNAE